MLADDSNVDYDSETNQSHIDIFLRPPPISILSPDLEKKKKKPEGEDVTIQLWDLVRVLKKTKL